MSPPIIIVSGLPRSGTSLLMQMLSAGGATLLTDSQRQADDSNPKGYYEFEPVKSLASGAPWIADARGKAIKVISQLLEHLPRTEQYRVLYLHRSLEEVLASQHAMLQRLGQKLPPQAAVQAAFQRHLTHIQPWLASQPHLTALALHFSDVIAQPQAAARQIAHFVGGELDIERMAAVVDQQLYRERR